MISKSPISNFSVGIPPLHEEYGGLSQSHGDERI